MAEPPRSLTWSAVIATRNRLDVLRRALACVAGQTRAPGEVIVVDASDDIEAGRAVLVADARGWAAGIEFHHVAASEAALPVQRNQGIGLAAGDVVFLIDDDSLMYPDCAAKIMAIYEWDEQEKIVGVQAGSAGVPPDVGEGASVRGERDEGPGGEMRSESRLRRWKRRITPAPFLDYGEVRMLGELPESVRAETDAARCRWMQGARMTFRRWVVEREPFEEALKGYAAGEDMDLSARAGRHGLIANCPSGRIHHLEATTGSRPDLRRKLKMIVCNHAVLHRLHGRDGAVDRRRLRFYFYHFGLWCLLADVNNRRFGFPATRGVLAGLRCLPQIYGTAAAELRAWYPSWQARKGA